LPRRHFNRIGANWARIDLAGNGGQCQTAAVELWAGSGVVQD
jgi:hypothetical protein